MAGSNQIRFCTQCSKSVYNLSAMTSAEAEALLNRIEKPCVRFYRRLDGTVVTTDRCRNGVTRVWRRFATAMGAMFVALGSLAGCDCSKLGICTQGKMVAPPSATTTPPPIADEPDADEEP
jgi:hypothetical protein